MRRIIYYLGSSIAIHILLFFFIWRLAPDVPSWVEEKPLLVEFRQEREDKSEKSPENAERFDFLGTEMIAEIRGLPAPLSGLPERESGYSGWERISQVSLNKPSFPEIPEDLFIPTPEEIMSRFKRSENENSGLPAGEAPEDSAGEEVESLSAGIKIEQGREFKWESGKRKLIKSTGLRFPEILLEEGQEVDVEATFFVAPSGQVIQVEITRSSGYTLVDRAVERTVAGYFFEESQVDRREKGVIRFHFRLERRFD